MEVPNMSQNTTKKKKKKKKNELVFKSCTSTYCILCRKGYAKNEAQEHLHSVAHHKELEEVLGINTLHKCYACKDFYIGLNGFTEHIATPQHKAKLQNLISSKVNPTPLCQILSPNLIKKILARNKRIKNTTKNKNRKQKLKQAANAALANHTPVSNGLKQGNIQQVNPNHANPPPRNQQAASKSAVVPNRGNKVTTLQAQRATLPQSGQISHNQDEFNGPDAHKVQKTWPAYYNGQYGDDDDGMDFTSDDLNEGGAIVFDHRQNKREEEEASAQRPAAIASTSSAAEREVDVTPMLRQIRRFLGIREPCRAEREARKQSIQAAAKAEQTSAGTSSGQASSRALTLPVRPPHVTPSPAPPAHPAKAKQTSSQGPTDATASPTLGPKIGSKVRVAHKPASDRGEKETVLKATLNKLCTLYSDKKELPLRKTLQKRAPAISATMPRFGNALPKPPPAQGDSARGADLTLSEGFHWESVPGIPPDAHLDEPSSENETKFDPRTLATSERSGAEQGSGEIIATSASEGEQKACKADKKKKKRPATETTDVAEMEPAAKKKPKSNKDQTLLQQLLDVSLTEEKVSKSLQDVDKSLEQARAALQVAYLEVQRLILLKQQLATEIGSLRTQRIEILQDMNGGSGVDEGASTSTQNAPPTNKALSIGQPTPAPITNPDSQSPSSADLPPLPSAAVQPTTSKTVGERAAAVTVERPMGSDSDLERKGAKQEHKVATFVPDRAGSSSAEPKNEGDESDDCFITSTASKRNVLAVIDLDELDDKEETDDEDQTSGSSSDEEKLLIKLGVQDDGEPSGSAQQLRRVEPSLGAFASHSSSVHHLLVSQGLLISSSGDKTTRAYSLSSKEREAEFTGHTKTVNAAVVSSIPYLSPRLFTGSSDQTIRCYDLKTKQCLEQSPLEGEVLCLHIAWNTLFAGLSSGSVASYDVKAAPLRQLDVFECHGPRGASCLATAQEGVRRLLLVGSFDSTISVRDAKNGLLLRSLRDHAQTVLCIQVASDMVFSGSSDAFVHAHNIHTGKLIRVYKGHGHSVTSLAITGGLMVTACLDKLVRVYNQQSPDCLQVYGGQSSMVMSLAVLDNVIYTGCSDGSIEAFKLNLRKNHRCWWQHCPLVFGVSEHLLQHVMGVHNKPSASIARCCWRNCSEQLFREELQPHMKRHVDIDSEVPP